MTPTKSGNELILATGYFGGLQQYCNDVIELSDGRLLVSWIQSDIAGEGSAKIELLPDSGQVNNSISIASTYYSLGINTSTDLTQLANGNIVVGWSDTRKPGTNDKYRVKILSSDGTSFSKKSIDLNANYGSVVALSNGNFVAIGQSYKGATFGGIYDPVGSLIKRFKVGSLSNVVPDPDVISLSNGNFFVCTPHQTNGKNYYGEIFSSDGKELSANAFQSDILGIFDRALTTSNGNVVVADDQGGQNINLSIYDVDGNRVTSIQVSTPGASYSGIPSLAALPNGQFVTTWQYANNDLNGIDGQIFNSDGTLSGTSFTITESPIAIPQYANVAPSGGNKFIVTWQDYIGNNASFRSQTFDYSGSLQQLPSAAEDFANDAFGGSLTSYMSYLADAAYHLGAQEIEAAGYNKSSATAESDYNQLGTSLRWLTESDLPSLQLSKSSDANFPFSGIDNGIYTNENAAALVGQSSDALFLSFRGTNDDPNILQKLGGGFAGVGGTPDSDDWHTMADYYRLLEPLLQGLFVGQDGSPSFLQLHPEINQVFVTGHSLGAAMVQNFMAGLEPLLAANFPKVSFEATTFADPGYQGLDNGGVNSSNTINIINEYDPVLQLLNVVTKDTGWDYVINFPSVSINGRKSTSSRTLGLALTGVFHEAELYKSIAGFLASQERNVDLSSFETNTYVGSINLFANVNYIPVTSSWNVSALTGSVKGTSQRDLFFVNGNEGGGTVNGGSGVDILALSAAIDAPAVSVDLGGGVVTFGTAVDLHTKSVEGVLLGVKDAIVRGLKSAVDYIYGGIGSLTFVAQGANDHIFGGSGRMDIFGSTGTEQVFVGQGELSFTAGTGKSIVSVPAAVLYDGRLDKIDNFQVANGDNGSFLRLVHEMAKSTTFVSTGGGTLVEMHQANALSEIFVTGATASQVRAQTSFNL